jgi:predicted lipoprotein with Yx(FWY)xxD motif
MRTLRVAAPLLGLSLILAACSGSGGGATAAASAAASVEAASPAASESASAAASESAAASPSEAASASASAAASGPAKVDLATTSLGSVLVGGADGKTLYIFTPDAAAAGKSVCNDKCAASWPPLLASGAPTLGTGLDAADFTTITRDDGTTQVAFYGQPLYYFAGDAAAGDVKGQGLNEKWYVVGADGKPIK